MIVHPNVETYHEYGLSIIVLKTAKYFLNHILMRLKKQIPEKAKTHQHSFIFKGIVDTSLQVSNPLHLGIFNKSHVRATLHEIMVQKDSTIL